MKQDNINGKNCDKDSNKFLGIKTKKNKNSQMGRKWKPYKYMTYEEKKRLADRETLKDHLKQEFRNNPKILKNLDFDRKSIKNITKPATPHNTSQFLSTNFCLGRNEKVPNSAIFVDNYSYDNKEEMTAEGIDETDEYCIPGGSMTEILNSNSQHLTQVETNEEEVLQNLTSGDNPQDLNNFRQIIENQDRLISHLITILNKSESNSNNKNGNIP